MSEIKTNGKMKVVGYVLIVVGLILTFVLFFGSAEAPGFKVDLIKYWTGIALFLLFGNAGKHIVGGYVQAKGDKPKES